MATSSIYIYILNLSIHTFKYSATSLRISLEFVIITCSYIRYETQSNNSATSPVPWFTYTN